MNKFVPRLEYLAELPSTPRSRTDFKNPERRFGIASRYDSVHRIKEESGGRVGDRLIAVERVEQIFTGWSSKATEQYPLAPSTIEPSEALSRRSAECLAYLGWQPTDPARLQKGKFPPSRMLHGSKETLLLTLPQLQALGIQTEDGGNPLDE